MDPQVMLNGSPGQKIFHARGLRQGDRLSPMLFILAMEPFHQIIEAAETANALVPLGIRNGRFRCSIYVDDVAVFAVPNLDELTALSRIAILIAKISGLLSPSKKRQTLVSVSNV